MLFVAMQDTQYPCLHSTPILSALSVGLASFFSALPSSTIAYTVVDHGLLKVKPTVISSKVSRPTFQSLKAYAPRSGREIFGLVL